MPGSPRPRRSPVGGNPATREPGGPWLRHRGAAVPPSPIIQLGASINQASAARPRHSIAVVRGPATRRPAQGRPRPGPCTCARTGTTHERRPAPCSLRTQGPVRSIVGRPARRLSRWSPSRACAHDSILESGPIGSRAAHWPASARRGGEGRSPCAGAVRGPVAASRKAAAPTHDPSARIIWNSWGARRDACLRACPTPGPLGTPWPPFPPPRPSPLDTPPLAPPFLKESPKGRGALAPRAI